MAKGNGSAGWADIATHVSHDFERFLYAALPELNEAVQIGEGQASFTATLQIKRGKRGKFVARLGVRTRAPREPIEYAMHMDRESDQLRLGFDPELHGTPEAAASGEEARA